VLPFDQKLTFGLLATITFKVVTFRAYTVPSASVIFQNSPWKSCSVRVFNTAYNSASITSIVSKWQPFRFIFCWGSRKQQWVGNDSHVVLGQKSFVTKVGWDGALSWCNSQFPCRQSSGRCLLTFSLSRSKTLQQCAEMTVWPARTDSLRTRSLMSKIVMSMLLSFFSPFSV
jgi:hypothetical protein